VVYWCCQAVAQQLCNKPCDRSTCTCDGCDHFITAVAPSSRTIHVSKLISWVLEVEFLSGRIFESRIVFHLVEILFRQPQLRYLIKVRHIQISELLQKNCSKPRSWSENATEETMLATICRSRGVLPATIYSENDALQKTITSHDSGPAKTLQKWLPSHESIYP